MRDARDVLGGERGRRHGRRVIAVDLVTGALGTATPIAAALGAGVAITRLTTMVRWPAGQAFVGGAVGFMLVVAPALAFATTAAF